MNNQYNNQNQFENDKRSVFCYLRVSTSHQNVGSQLHAIQQYCKQHGIMNYKLFQDEAISGAKDSRPALNEMMKEIGEKKCKMVIVFAFSRFSRSCTHLLQSLEYLKKHKCRFLSISESIDTSTPVGTALLACLGALAQLERDLIRERVIAGLQRAKMNGVQIGRKKLRPSELIRKLYLSNVSYREISRITGVSSGAVGAEVKLLKSEMPLVKIIEQRLSAKRPKVIAFKNEYDLGDIRPLPELPKTQVEESPEIPPIPKMENLERDEEPLVPAVPPGPIDVYTS